MENVRNGYDHNAKGSFWKNSGRAVPGRPSLRKEVKPIKVMSGTSSYQDFQASVSDAWDMGDDEIISGMEDAKISKVISRSAALSVINNHRSGAAKTSDESVSPSANNPSTKVIPQRSANKPIESSVKSGAEQTLPQSQPVRHYPGRPRAVKISALTGKEVNCESKVERFLQLRDNPVLDLNEFKQLSWSGVPVKVRAVTWRLLSGYLPANSERRQEVLERKRSDYYNLVKQYYDAEKDDDTYRQIHIDIPRMSPYVSLFQQQTVQLMFERILYIWAIRHPASGYVQGINDLGDVRTLIINIFPAWIGKKAIPHQQMVTPFFMVFLQEVVPFGEDLDNWEVDKLTEHQRSIIEADSFWCLSKFLDSIQDNYIFAQLGIQYKVNQLKELIKRIDQPLHEHLQNHGVDYLQFSFRWMNNLLTRELPLHCTIRLWDTYLAESDEFATFQLYVCAAFLLHWRDKLMHEKDFQGILILLQNVPTQNWQDSHIGVLVAEAFRLKFAFADAPNHLQNTSSKRTTSISSDR